MSRSFYGHGLLKNRRHSADIRNREYFDDRKIAPFRQHLVCIISVYTACMR